MSLLPKVITINLKSNLKFMKGYHIILSTAIDNNQHTLNEILSLVTTLATSPPNQKFTPSPPPKPQPLDYFTSIYKTPLKLTLSRLPKFISDIRNSTKSYESSPTPNTTTSLKDRIPTRTTLFKENPHQNTRDTNIVT